MDKITIDQGEASVGEITPSTFIVITLVTMSAIAFLGFEQTSLKARIRELQGQVQNAHSDVQKEITAVRDLSSKMASTHRKTLNSLRSELDAAKEAAKHAAQTSEGQSRISAELTVQRLARQLRAEEQRQRAIQEQVKKEFQDTHQIVAVADARISAEVGTVRSEISAVRSDVALTESNLNNALADLRHVVGDMGVMSGLIATNQRELALLKRLGDRTYTEFRLAKSKQPKQVGVVNLILKRSDPGKGVYSIQLTTDDIPLQKRDRSLNEPVQFYLGGRKQPCEIVVNRVGKNEIAGYLSVPKVNEERE